MNSNPENSKKKAHSSDKGEVLIYQAADGQTSLEVTLKDDTVWLNLNQLSELFNREKSVVSRHIKNIYFSKELLKSSTVAKYATVQKEGDRSIRRNIEYYNLDMIISLGYRVNSKRGTQFRIWANKVLKEFLVKGYVLNENRLRRQLQSYHELKRSVALIERVSSQLQPEGSDIAMLVQVLRDFSYSLQLLDEYDHGRLAISNVSEKEAVSITYGEAIEAINVMKRNFPGADMFGCEKDDSLKSSLQTINQTFDGKPLYPSIEEKAANMLYFLVKNHSFIDGNKRIAASLFIWFLERNQLLYRTDGSRRLADNALVALTLMIAVSDPKEKDVIVKVIVNLINQRIKP